MGIGEGRVSPNDGPTGPQEKDKMQALAAAPRARPDENKLNKLPLPPNNNGLMMEVWASVASWFFRPDAPHPPFPPGPMAATLPGLRGTPRPPNPRPAAPHYPLAPTICTAIRCTVPGCTCDCFTPGKTHIRFCENCSHGWVPHALDKLGFKHLYGQSPVEPVQPNVAFDIASLVLYGTQALPIRLKILLDRLFSVLQREEVLQVLHGFGWTHEDYARGYILQEPHGGVLERWNICSPEEEPLVLQQFLRFGETRAITQQLLLAQADQAEKEKIQQMKVEADLKRLIMEKKPKEETKSRTPPPIQSPAPPSPVNKQSALNLKQNGPVSPPVSVNTSPISLSPLNRLQSMQPFDFRKVSTGTTFPSGDSGRRRHSDASDLGNGPSSWHLPPPLPMPPTSTPSVPINMTHSFSNERKSPKMEKLPELGSEEEDDDEENSYSALNLSRDGMAKQKKLNNVRKGVSPVKRSWGSSGGLPLNLGTQLINPTTGKKRVQCNVCLKTFCDKGALKIHFSAVHLREMHKCTVEGCNMMFSSRRSRNRHSANPNPKLHSPHLRRKISPHDGRSAQSHPMLIPPHGALSLPGPLSFGAFPLLTPPPEMRHQSSAMDLKQSLDLTMKYDDRRSYQSSDDGAGVTNSDYMEEEDDDYEGIVVVGDDEGDDDKGSDEDAAKRAKTSMSDGDSSNEDSLSVVDSQSVKEDIIHEGTSKRGRKRKSQNPTKCSQQPSQIAINDGLSSDGEEGRNQEKKENPLQRLESLSQGEFGSPSRSRASSVSRDSTDESPEGMKRGRKSEKPLHPGFHPDFLSRLYSADAQLGYPLNGDRVPLPFPGLSFPGMMPPFMPNGVDTAKDRSSSSPASPASPVSNGGENGTSEAS